MNKRRLLKLADLLEADAKNRKGVKFDLSNWSEPASAGKPFERDKPIPVDCNTAACAVGIAAISGAFKRQGLSYRFCNCTSKLHIVPTYDGEDEMEAVSRFFDLTRDDADHLFQPGSYKVTKGARAERAVTKRIRDFVAGKVSSS